MKTRFYVAYDAGDPSEAEICSIMSGLGRRRAELVRALILHAVRSYGRSVLMEENLDVLFYLMKEEEERELVKTVYQRLELFEEQNRQFHDEAKLAREIIRLRDPYQDVGNSSGKPTLQLQTLKSTFNNCVADQMQSMPEVKLLPETPQQQEAVEDLQDLVHHVVYETNKYDKIHRRRAEDLYGPGTVVTQVVWDPDLCFGKGDIALIRWPVEAFLWDPMAEYIQDARAIIKVSWHPKSWYEEHYPDEAKYINEEDGLYNEVGMTEEQKGHDGTDEGRSMLVEYWYRTYNASKHKYTINVAYCAGGALLSHHKGVYDHGMYPFIIDVHSNVEGSMVGEGLIKELVPMMRYINRYAHYIDTNLRRSSKGRIIMRRNANIDREAFADFNQDFIEGDSVVQGEDWAWVQDNTFNSMISQQMLQFESDLKQDAGANQFTRGETTGGIVSGKAITALQTAGSKIATLRTSTLNAGFKEIAEQILWLMAQFYDDKRVVMVTGRDNQIRAVTVEAERFFGKRGKGSVTPPPYVVQVEISTRDPNRIDAQNEMYMQAYTMAAQAQQYFPLSALFQIMNIEGKDRLLPVIRENEQTQNMITQLQQQNEQMMQQLAQMQQENDSLKRTSSQLTNALASTGGGFAPGATKVGAAGGAGGSIADIVNNSRLTSQQFDALPEMGA